MKENQKNTGRGRPLPPPVGRHREARNL